MSKKLATVQTALQRATTYGLRPEIPAELTKGFKRWTHCEIRVYQQRHTYRKPNGKTTKSRRVSGFVFIFLANESGKTSRKPIRVLRRSKVTRRDFTTYARGLTENVNHTLANAIISKANN